MVYTEKQLNIGILLHALYEKASKGINQYTIHNDWWEISEVALFERFVEKGLIVLEGRTISFTKQGEAEIKRVFTSMEKEVSIGNIFTQINENARKILEVFERGVVL